MDLINMENFISLVEANDCIWKNSTINANNLIKIESAWRSIAFTIYENFNELKEKQKKFWVNNLKRKWKLILNKYKNLGQEYEHFRLLRFLDEPRNCFNLSAQDYKSNIKSEPVKCGEILFNKEFYIYKCMLCDSTFDLLNSFETHISIMHSLPLFTGIRNEKLAEIPTGENVEYLIEEDFSEVSVKQEFNIDEPHDEGSKNIVITREPKNQEPIILNTVEAIEYVGGLECQENNLHRENSEQTHIVCPHCTILFDGTNEHDIDHCFEIQQKILKLNGDLRALRDEGIFHCDRCARYFNCPMEMHKHRREKHYEICPVCKIRLLNIENHVISHHSDIDYKKLKIPDSFNSGIFKCKFCGKIIMAKDIWIKHKNKCSNLKQEIHNKIT